MKDLIEMKSNIPVVDSRSLVPVFGIEHRSIFRLIKKHEEKLNTFGKVRFEITPSDSGQNQSMAYLNERQTLILLTYTRSNEQTDKHRIKLIDQFVKMRDYIQKQQVVRLSGIEVRKSLTDTVKDSGENERMHGHGYSTYTKMVYEVTGLKEHFKQFKLEQSILPDKVKLNYREYISSEELKRVELAESLIKPLLELDKQYNEIRDTLKPLFNVKELK